MNDLFVYLTDWDHRCDWFWCDWLLIFAKRCCFGLKSCEISKLIVKPFSGHVRLRWRWDLQRGNHHSESMTSSTSKQNSSSRWSSSTSSFRTVCSNSSRTWAQHNQVLPHRRRPHRSTVPMVLGRRLHLQLRPCRNIRQVRNRRKSPLRCTRIYWIFRKPTFHFTCSSECPPSTRQRLIQQHSMLLIWNSMRTCCTKVSE